MLRGMTTVNAPWPAGTPCWVDLMATDLDRTQGFYAALLGWTYSESDPEQYGGYCNALLDGRRVAGLSPTPPGMEGTPNTWTVYLATDDIHATGRAFTEGGAQEAFPPMEIDPFGHMGSWIDPTGALVGAWQSREHTGFEVRDEPGAVAWSDLMTSDFEAAKSFYGSVFGYSYADMSSADNDYVMFDVPGLDYPAGGIGQASEGDPIGWTVCFQVEDADVAAQQVVDAGGTVLKDPYDFEFGRLVEAKGPDGELFTLLQPKQDMSAA